MTFLARAAALFLLLAPFRLSADAEPVPPAPERMTLERFGRAHPACREWTDGCAICLRQGDKASVACSLPGIACEPRDLACRDPMPAHVPVTPPDPKHRAP